MREVPLPPQEEKPDLQQQSEPDALPIATDSRAHVLVVEDQPQMARMIAAALATLYRVTTASDGQEGLLQALTLRPDIILCDILMPHMNGEQLVGALRAQPDFDDVPIVVLSGRTDEQIRIRLLQAGAQDFLLKPFHYEELRVRVANLLMMRQVRQVLQQEVTQQNRNLKDLVNEVVERKRESERAVLALQESEANFRRSQSQLRAIIDASQEAMLLLTTDGHPIKVNRRFTDFFGLDDTIVLSQSPGQLIALLKGLFKASDLPDQWLTWSTSDQVHIFREQLVQVALARREFYLSSLPVMNVDQTYLGRLYVWHDVTHEREVDRMKSDFVSLVSHELRTPLTSIQGYIDLLLTDESVGELTELQREFLLITRNNGRRLASITNDLLDLSHIESGKVELHRAPLDLNLLIGELLPSFQPVWETKRQMFALHLPEPAPIVLGDAERVTQILTNLLSNAHKYTLEEGHIDLSVEAAGSSARITITDNGIGLSTEEQAKLFTRFYRVPNAAARAWVW